MSTERGWPFDLNERGDDDLGQAAQDAGDWFESFGRAGWVAKGLVYGLVGLLFVGIGFGPSDSDEANQAGAIESIAEQPAGRVLLIAVGAGLLLYAIWRFFTAVLPGD